MARMRILVIRCSSAKTRLPPGRYLNAFDLKDKFRYLTPVEMCRLQTLPDDYLDGIAPNTAMSLTGNGWTVDVIAHLLKGIECR